MKITVNLSHSPTFAVIDYIIKPKEETKDRAKGLVSQVLQDEEAGQTVDWGHYFPGQEFMVVIQGVAFYGPGEEGQDSFRQFAGASFVISAGMAWGLKLAMNDLDKKARETAWDLKEWNEYLFM